MSRRYTKFGWQSDTDCRLIKDLERQLLVIAPPLLPPEPCLIEPGTGRGRWRGTPGAFRWAYLGKAIRWLRRRLKRGCGSLR